MKGEASVSTSKYHRAIDFASGCVDPGGAQHSVLCGVLQHSGNPGVGILAGGLHFCWNKHLEVALVAWESGGTTCHGTPSLPFLRPLNLCQAGLL